MTRSQPINERSVSLKREDVPLRQSNRYAALTGRTAHDHQQKEGIGLQKRQKFLCKDSHEVNMSPIMPQSAAYAQFEKCIQLVAL